MRDDDANQWNNLNFEDLTHRNRLQVDDLKLITHSLTHPFSYSSFHSNPFNLWLLQQCANSYSTNMQYARIKITQGHPCQWGYVRCTWHTIDI